MALNLPNFQHKGFALNVYARINGHSARKEGGISTGAIHVEYLANRQESEPIHYTAHEMPLASDGLLLSDAYTYLKTLPEFADAKDV